MTKVQRQPEKRTLQFEIEIDASVEAVWKALTDAEELTRWFPLGAEVKPGANGSFFLSWGPGEEGAAKIEVWEPNRRLRYIQQGLEGYSPEEGHNFAAENEPASHPAEGAPPPMRIVEEWFLESRGGKTVLRLVTSGFASVDWQDEYFEGIRHGWPYMFRNLRHYLQNHPGKPRLVAWPRAIISEKEPAAWEKVLGPKGLNAQGNLKNLREGDSYSIQAVTDEKFTGILTGWDPPFGCSMTVQELNNALLGVSVMSCGGTGSAGLWLSTYGVPKHDVRAFEERWMKVLAGLFPGSEPRGVPSHFQG